MTPQMGVWTAEDDAAAIAAHAAILDAHTLNELEVLRTGEYYSSDTNLSATLAITANELYGVPLVVARNITVDRIAFEVTGAGAGGTTARMGIYNNGTNLYPGTLLLDAGTVSVASTGIKAITIAQALPKGIYFLALVSDGTPTIRAVNQSGSTNRLLGILGTGFNMVNQPWRVAFVYAALPDPFTAGAAVPVSHIPRLVVRVASLD